MKRLLFMMILIIFSLSLVFSISESDKVDNFTIEEELKPFPTLEQGNYSDVGIPSRQFNKKDAFTKFLLFLVITVVVIKICWEIYYRRLKSYIDKINNGEL